MSQREPRGGPGLQARAAEADRDRTPMHTLALANIGMAIAAFAVASAMGVLQGLSVADVDFPQRSESLYYESVTAHGVLMALVFTTFFIMGLGYVFAQESLGRIVGRRTAWFAFWLGLSGTVMTVTVILLGELRPLHLLSAAAGASALLHRRHPPHRRVVDLGRRDDRELPLVAARASGRAVPLAIHGMLATIIVWYLATTGLAIEVVGMLIPWSLGWVEEIDPMVARTLLLVVRPSTRVLLAAARVRALVHRAAARRRRPAVQRSSSARMVFILFVVLSTPVGLHHQFEDPGISSGWKFAHTLTTLRHRVPEPGDGLHRDRVARGGRPHEGRHGGCSTGSEAAVERSVRRRRSLSRCWASCSAGSAAPSTRRTR